jgi:ABC-type multidrug transport system ATPase subunit
MQTSALKLEGVRKTYGKRTALAGLDLSVARGSITGLIGPNGAGKTTCFGVVGGLLKIDAGSVDVLGQGPFDARKQRGMLGMLPQDSELAPHGRVRAQLIYLAELQGLRKAQAHKEADRVIDLVALRERTDGRLGELSHGMRRRVSVAQALLGSPPLVLLDEPTSGLDPHLVKHMRDVIVEQNRSKGSTFLVSSHVLSDLEAIADAVVFMEQGRAIKSGALAHVTGKGRTIRFRLTQPPDLDVLRTKLVELVLDARGDELLVAVPESAVVAQINRRVLEALFALDLSVTEIHSGESLERTYLDERSKWQG